MVDKLGPAHIVPIPRPRPVSDEDAPRKPPKEQKEPEQKAPEQDEVETDEVPHKGGFIDDHA
ncbi:hypothetical protein [Pseudohalioglobus lutimaris]|uniref:Uncharacterized protein n=1 Tax=Pseudohalioglobus lutimaris TaxID=1737061 RepID=A0A2N5X1F4_9GAMM|nr:hypothetical protein [Pseudohalioglobus lutimaris]PLW68313.1 hypothetical protein C0039_13030 [Pseudohalioglobus lutimaris]